VIEHEELHDLKQEVTRANTLKSSVDDSKAVSGKE